jgi:hypothetical protein
MLNADGRRIEAWKLRHRAQLAADPEIKRQFLELAAARVMILIE